jgi:hypothetical protein
LNAMFSSLYDKSCLFYYATESIGLAYFPSMTWCRADRTHR